MVHRSPVYSYVSDEAFEVVEGVDSVFVGFTGAIFPRSKRTWVEVKSICLLVFHSRVFRELEVALEQIVFVTPQQRRRVSILWLWSANHARIEALLNSFSLGPGGKIFV